jgi:hypothetical protein
VVVEKLACRDLVETGARQEVLQSFFQSCRTLSIHQFPLLSEKPSSSKAAGFVAS